ncbi:peptidase G2 autoproteolytic cleavage domain-containing protein [Bacillus mycoides]|uniref:Peptidase G2 n=2 Tax=Bacillus cereus group TaxID=86661 RepID=A0A2C1E0K7_BACCE|nr:MULTISPECIES: peptidase G2 autoproteolytic cleavage domain-containing protein [Bacillus cereus group]OFD82630.1 peptidase G2 [Bacillus mycoides]OFD83014.1 peptidase G2 [Bacillus mycoides]OFD85445.1 peptidase G2 [Bacillus mycoides]PGT05450.1 peptidase G2 [Bacillus cereus]
MKKKRSKQKRNFSPLYHPIYGINNWCSIRAAAIEEIEEREEIKTGKTRGTYISLENAVMRRIIDNRKIKALQKKKRLSHNNEPILESKNLQENINKEIPETIKEKIQAEIPRASKEKAQAEIPRASKEKAQTEIPKAIKEKVQAEIPKAIKEKAQAEIPKAIKEKAQTEIPKTIKEKAQAEIPTNIIQQVTKIKEELTLTNDIKKEDSTIIHPPILSPTPAENEKVARYAYKEGLHSTADGIASHAEGFLTHTEGAFSHAEGSKTKATGHSSHSEGSETTAGGSYSHAEGKHAIALGEAAHAEGTATIANGFSSHAEGNHTSTANFAGSHIMGRFGTAEEAYSWFIANGTSETDHNIGAKWLAHNGEMYIDGASYNASGTDFAQMFETVDHRPIDVGYFVTFSREEKIRKATSNDSFILGISSATPALIGNSGALSWQKRYETDSFGKRQYTRTNKQEIQPLLNTEWDPACKYISRKDRTEWLPVGLIGQMLVHDDGTCEPHGYCRPNDDGIATKAESGFFVIKRTGENQILILFR